MLNTENNVNLAPLIFAAWRGEIAANRDDEPVRPGLNLFSVIEMGGVLGQ